jgi:hypothetical protein
LVRRRRLHDAHESGARRRWLLRDLEFDDASGFTVEFGWKWIGLHYTKIEYSSLGFEDADASNIGIRFTGRFGGSN